MEWTRRQFVAGSGVGLAAIGALRGRSLFGQPAPVGADFEVLRGHVGIFTGWALGPGGHRWPGRGGAIGWLIAPDGVVVVDSQFPDTAQICLDGVKQRSARPIDALINTHHHGDHTGGNAVFRPAAGKIVAHASVPALQRKAAAAARLEAIQAYPDTTFDAEWKMDLGSEIVSASHHGPAHTGGDIAIVFEKANVVHMGDLLFNRIHPRVDVAAGGSVTNWLAVLDTVAGAHSVDTIFIASHTRDGFTNVTRQADVLLQKSYFTAVLDHVQKGIAARKSREEVIGLEALPGFPDHVNLPPLLTLAGVLGAAFDELTAKASPGPDAATPR